MDTCYYDGAPGIFQYYYILSHHYFGDGHTRGGRLAAAAPLAAGAPPPPLRPRRTQTSRGFLSLGLPLRGPWLGLLRAGFSGSLLSPSRLQACLKVKVLENTGIFKRKNLGGSLSECCRWVSIHPLQQVKICSRSCLVVKRSPTILLRVVGYDFH